MKPDHPNKNNGGKPGNNRNGWLGMGSIIFWALVFTMLLRTLFSSMDPSANLEIEYSLFRDWVRQDLVEEVQTQDGQYNILLKDGVTARLAEDGSYLITQEEPAPAPTPSTESTGSLFLSGLTEPERPVYITAPPAIRDDSLLPLLEEHNVTYGAKVTTWAETAGSVVLSVVLPFALTLGAMLLFFRLMSGKAGGSGGGLGGMGGIGGVGKANAKVYVEKKTGVTFRDVAGQDEAKESLVEIIDFLHNPQKYTEIGAKLPKGALLVGPPGTGKTLLAKAVAGEANVPFFSISGSDFVEMFVGVGASRVRDLFKEASKMAPCIVFIDEIDTIGKSRDNRMGGNDEREQTLNQLLAEMDGFDPTKGVILLAATNRPEVLDQALLRPGRFDRRIIVDRPNLAGRLATLQVHTRNIRLAEDVNLDKIAQATAGCVGADLANLVNEAALRAVRKGRKAVNQNDLLAAFETVIAGSEKKGTVITQEEKRIIAYHEVGHALVAAKQKNAQPVSKITIVPHTQGTLGYTLHLPEEEKFLMSKEDILAEIRTLLAGRSSEEIVCDTMTSGAANDIERATEMARNLVARFGMCDEFDMMALGTIQSQYLDGSYSMTCAQETYAAADRETIKIIRQCHEEAKQILRDNRELLDKIAAYLLQKETITGQEMMAIIEGRDPETVDNYGASRDGEQKLFRPSVPETIEAPAKHINIVSEPIPMPDFDQSEEKQPESPSAEEKPSAQDEPQDGETK